MELFCSEGRPSEGDHLLVSFMDDIDLDLVGDSKKFDMNVPGTLHVAVSTSQGGKVCNLQLR